MSRDILEQPQVYSKRRLRLPAILAVVLALMAVGAFFLSRVWIDYTRPGILDPSGGMYFFNRVALDVPVFRQNDARWGKDLLGPTENTLGAEGCAVSSASMVLNFYGIDTDPQRLNIFLNAHKGYTPEGWIYWEAAAELEPGRVRHAYEDRASHQLIDSNLSHGNPVIAKLRLASGTTHFVVIAGKSGFDYLICDPGAGGSRGLYPLHELGSRIEGLRYYARLNTP